MKKRHGKELTSGNGPPSKRQYVSPPQLDPEEQWDRSLVYRQTNGGSSPRIDASESPEILSDFGVLNDANAIQRPTRDDTSIALSHAQPGTTAEVSKATQASASDTARMGREANTRNHRPMHVYRVKGIALEATKSDIASALKSYFAEPGAKVTIKSLATAPQGQTKVATVRLEGIPIQLPAGKAHHLNMRSENKCQNQLNWTVDDHFHGLTVLHCPPAESHKIDIVAISGLGSHAYGSFKEKGGTHMWLSDSLPNAIPTARVAIYGYESGLANSTNFQNLDDLGNSLAKAIQTLQRGHSTQKPIIFIAHSLGGLILKEAIIQLSNSKTEGISRTVDCIYGAVFFGVPNDGLNIASFIPIVKNGPNRFLLESLGQNNSQILKKQRREFIKAFNFEGSSEIYCFYETCQSETAKKDSNGDWTMGGKLEVLVNTASATHCRPWEDTNDNICPLQRNHSTLVKFGPHDHEYDIVLSTIQGMVDRASHCLQRRKKYLVPSSERPPIMLEANGGEHNKALLDSLGFDQINARHMTIGKAHAKTCKWLLKKSEYLDWLNPRKLDEHWGFLWIKGKPGAGKSTLMKFILQAAQRRKREDEIFVSFFFNARGVGLEKSTLGMYRSILLQLLERIPGLQVVLNSLRGAKSNGDSQQWSIEILQSLFEKAVLRLGKHSLICFIDALDECEERQIRDMISFFERHYPHITIKKGLSLVLERQEEHEQDIISFLDSELKIGHTKLAEQIRADLKQKASGVFMWVVLVVGILQQEYDDGRKHTLRKRLRDIPGDLHELFRDILTRDHRNRDELLLCIQWVLFARNPLTPEQLYFAILSGTDTAAVSEWNSEELEELDISKFILSSSKGLAEVTRSKDPTVQFIHESVRDFLLKEEGLKEVWSSPGRDVQGQSHERLKQCCLSYMSIGFSILKFEGTQERVRQQSEKEFPFLKFAVQNILFHADAAQGRGICQKDFLKTLQLTNWTKLNNLFEKHKVRRYGPNASLLYILAEQNFENLIKRRPDEQSCFQVETERYGAPILAAIATASRDTVYALLSAEAEAEPLMSPLHELCERYHESDGSPSNFGREFRFSPKRGLLIYLIERKENEIVMFILSSSKYNAGIGNTDVTGRTALSFAVEYCTADVVGLLIERGAEIDLADKKGRSPLSYAVCHKHIDVVRLLLDRGAQIDLADQYGRSPLSYAARHTHVDVVRLLLGRGAQIDLADNAGRTPLLHAVAFDSEKTMQVLLNKGARIEEADKEGRTPLSHAAEGSEVCMRLLLTQGASVEMTDKNGRTPLSHAAAAGIGTCTRLLLDRGAQTEIADVRGRTPLSHAAQARNPTALKVLLDHKAHIDMTDSQGRTPLSHAAGSVSSDGLRLLIGAGAQIEMADNNGRTPLSYAAEMGQTKMLQLLIDNGSNVDVPDNKGRTPLSYAAACSQKIPGRRYSNAVRLLLARGAETETADNTGQTPLSYARASRNSDAYIIQLFKEHARMSTTMDPP